MFNSAIIEVIVGMIFIYSLLSILVTQVNTLVTNVLNTRAKHLMDGIRQIISDPVIQAKFLSHPLIQIVPPEKEAMPEEVLSAQSAEVVSNRQPLSVNYIPPTLFSQALLDIIAAQAARNLYKPLYDAVERALNGADEARAREMVRRLQGSTLTTDELRAYFETLNAPARQSLIITLDRVQKAQTALTMDDSQAKLIPLMEGIRHIQDPIFQKAMDTLLATARSVDEAAAKMEFWFNARMDQLSDTYRRNIQYLSILIGMLMAITLNVDSLHVARTLWDDPALRATIAATAQASIDNGTLQNDINAQPQPGIEGETTSDDALQAARNSIDELLNLRLPIGWELTAVEGGCATPSENPAECNNPRNLWNLLPTNNPDWLGMILWKLAGYAVTIIAIAQGAPFWFELLNRLARGRSS
jgi:hypothetical protein